MRVHVGMIIETPTSLKAELTITSPGDMDRGDVAHEATRAVKSHLIKKGWSSPKGKALVFMYMDIEGDYDLTLDVWSVTLVVTIDEEI
jgi:hypothetical protein